MRYGIAILLLLIQAFPALSQDTPEPEKEKPARNFGLYGGFSYSNLRLTSSAFLLPDKPGTGSVRALNSPAFAGGVFLVFPQSRLRAGVEFNMMPTELEYDMGNANKEESWIYPLTVELPLHSFVTGLFSESRLRPELIIGGRIVFPIPLLNSVYPELRTTSLNLETGIRIPVKYAKTTGSVELLYSAGILNLLKPVTDNVKNHSVESLYRDFIGIRGYFN